MINYKADIIIISSNVTCSRHDIAEKLVSLALNNNHSLKLQNTININNYQIINECVCNMWLWLIHLKNVLTGSHAPASR
jgi:hypothetical protein